MAINLDYAMQPEGFPGLIADAATLSDKLTYVQGEVSASLPFGIMAAQGAVSVVQGTPDLAILPVDGNSRHVGIVIHSHSYVPGFNLDAVGIMPKALINVMQTGRIWAYAEAGAYVKGAKLFVRHTANGVGTSQKGAIRIDADTARARVNNGLTCAKAVTLAAPGYVMVDVSIPVDRIA